MPVPDFQSVMRPVLVVVADGKDYPPKAIRAGVASHFALTEADLQEEIPSGRAKTFNNRVGWAITYLYRAGLITRPKQALYRITERGLAVLDSHPTRVDMKVLSEFEEFLQFKQSSKGGGSSVAASSTKDSSETPEEQMETSFRELTSALAAEILDQIIAGSAEFFEQLVVDVLSAMGYGGPREDAAQRVGQSGDEGIDGVIREDRLGLDTIYIQAKKWTPTVGRPEIQKFIGALQGQKASKGIFITTSSFSKEAVDYASGVSPRVILIDGQELARLMIESGVGVTSTASYALNRLDLDYFSSEDDSAVIERA